MSSQFFLQGPGRRNDACFEIYPLANTARVIAERGLSNCWDDLVSIEEARKRYRQLLEEGWAPTTSPRRSPHQLQRDIQD